MDSRPPCHYCKDVYEEVGGSDVELAWHCTRCGTTASAERVHNVHDAAMAAFAAHERTFRDPDNAEIGMDYECLLDCLWGACRAAKEVERG